MRLIKVCDACAGVAGKVMQPLVDLASAGWEKYAEYQLHIIKWKESASAGVAFTETEVTVDQYQRCEMSGHCSKAGREGNVTANNRVKYDHCNAGWDDRRDHPINCVTHQQAQEYCAWIGGRLPTEDEWLQEATMAGKQDGPWGDGPATCRNAVLAAGRRRSNCGKQVMSQEVCSRKRGNSAAGLCDMIGNVAEWTATPSIDGAHFRIVGGGYAMSEANPPSVGTIRELPPRGLARDVGFRCVRDP
jgi:formylglycine-generating enzyme required for sulfatase activity